jgi:hypothetical protein
LLASLSLIAMLALALMPTLSHALAWASQGAQGHAAWTEICTAAGVQRVVLAEGLTPVAPADARRGDDPTLPPTMGAMEDCPMCVLGGHAPPLLGGFIVHALALQRDGPPVLFLLAPRPLFAWAPAQARAPPLNA